MSEKEENSGVTLNQSDDDIGFGSWDLSDDIGSDEENVTVDDRPSDTSETSTKESAEAEDDFTTEIDLSQAQEPASSDDEEMPVDIPKMVDPEVVAQKQEEPKKEKKPVEQPKPVKPRPLIINKQDSIARDDSQKNEQSTDENEEKKKSKIPLIIIILIVTVVILLLLFLFLRHVNNSAAETAPTADTQSEVLEVTTSEIPYDPTGEPIDATTLVTFDANTEQLTASPETVNPAQIGEQTIKYTITKDGEQSETSQTFNVVDKTAPEIKLKSSSVDVKTGDTFDPKSNIESVTDNLDGTLQENNVSNSSGYTVTSNIDTNKAGTYEVTVTATDKANNSTNQKFTVYVKNDTGSAVSSNNADNNRSENDNQQSQSNDINTESNIRRNVQTPAPRQRTVTYNNVDSQAANAQTRSLQGLSQGETKGSAADTPTATPDARKTVWACTQDGQTFSSEAEAEMHHAMTGHSITSYKTTN